MPRRTAAYLIFLTLFAIGCWQIIYFWLGAGNGGLRLIQTAGCVMLASAMIWAVKRFGHKIWIAAAFLALGLMLLPATVLVRVIPSDSAQPFASSLAFSLFMLMTASLRFYFPQAWLKTMQGGKHVVNRTQGGRRASTARPFSYLFSARS